MEEKIRVVITEDTPMNIQLDPACQAWIALREWLQKSHYQGKYDIGRVMADWWKQFDGPLGEQGCVGPRGVQGCVGVQGVQGSVGYWQHKSLTDKDLDPKVHKIEFTWESMMDLSSLATLLKATQSPVGRLPITKMVTTAIDYIRRTSDKFVYQKPSSVVHFKRACQFAPGLTREKYYYNTPSPSSYSHYDAYDSSDGDDNDDNDWNRNNPTPQRVLERYHTDLVDINQTFTSMEGLLDVFPGKEISKKTVYTNTLTVMLIDVAQNTETLKTILSHACLNTK